MPFQSTDFLVAWNHFWIWIWFPGFARHYIRPQRSQIIVKHSLARIGWCWEWNLTLLKPSSSFAAEIQSKSFGWFIASCYFQKGSIFETNLIAGKLLRYQKRHWRSFSLIHPWSDWSYKDLRPATYFRLNFDQKSFGLLSCSSDHVIDLIYFHFHQIFL